VAAPGEVNRIATSVSSLTGALTLVDSGGAAPTPGTGCAAGPSPSEVVCDGAFL
jgi:hypothetical protein